MFKKNKNRQFPRAGSGNFFKRLFSRTHRIEHHAPDYTLLGTTLVLLFVGLITLSSATSILSFQETSGTYYFLRRQLTHGVLPGLLAMFILYRIPYRKYLGFTSLFLFAVYALLLVVFVPSLHPAGYPTKSWIDIGFTTIQTSEIAKLFFILWLAGWCTTRHASIRSLTVTSIPFFLITASIAGLLMLQPDAGTMILFMGIAMCMFFVAQGNLLHILFATGLGSLIIIPVILRAPYRFQRLTSFLHPSADTQGAGYQIYQALIALGSGSWFGLGIGRSQQKFYFVPEVESDSIFAIIGEELGFIISAILLILFVSLFLRGIRIARNAPDRYGALVAWGVTLLITLQVVVNVGAIVGLLPLTGIPLPFISLGGTNIVVLLAGLGILLNISTYTKEQHG